MNKKVIIALSIVIVVLCAAIAYVVVYSPNSNPPSSSAKHKLVLLLLQQKDDKSWGQWQAEGVVQAGTDLNYSTAVADNVAAADFTRVAGGYIADGYDVVIGGAYEFQQPILQMASQYPNVSFISYGAYQFANNTAGFNVWPHEGFYLAGQLAAMMTTTGKIGYVDAFKYPYDLCARNGFVAGVKSINANATVLEAWVGTWVDPQQGYEAATAMIDSGADVLIHDASGPGSGMLQAAKDRGKLAIGAYYNQSYLGDFILTTVANKFDAPLKSIIAEIDARKFGNKAYNFGMKEGGVDLTLPLSNRVPQNVSQTLMDARDQILKGNVNVPFVTDTEMNFD